MHDADLVVRYNYAEFTHANVDPWMRFSESPPVGSQAPDFPLWQLDGSVTSLREQWASHVYTVIEFGSFT